MLRKTSLALATMALTALMVGCGGGNTEKPVPPMGENAGKAPAGDMEKMPPAGTTEKMPAAGEKKMAMQTTCPCTGMPIDKANFTDYNGKRIYFCSKGCIEAFKKDPEKYLKPMEDKGVMFEKAPAGDMGTMPAGENKPM